MNNQPHENLYLHVKFCFTLFCLQNNGHTTKIISSVLLIPYTQNYFSPPHQYCFIFAFLVMTTTADYQKFHLQHLP